MPLKVDPRDRKLLLGAVVLFVLLLVGAVLFGGSGAKVDIPSSYSTASGGAKAAFLLLSKIGYNI